MSPKMTDKREAQRETLENGMAALAAIQHRLEIFDLRLNQIERRTGLNGLITPAREDLQIIKKKLATAQKHFSTIWNEKWNQQYQKEQK